VEAPRQICWWRARPGRLQGARSVLARERLELAYTRADLGVDAVQQLLSQPASRIDEGKGERSGLRGAGLRARSGTHKRSSVEMAGWTPTTCSRRMKQLEKRWSNSRADARGYAIAAELLAVGPLWAAASIARLERLAESSPKRALSFSAKIEREFEEGGLLGNDLAAFTARCKATVPAEALLDAVTRAETAPSQWYERTVPSWRRTLAISPSNAHHGHGDPEAADAAPRRDREKRVDPWRRSRSATGLMASLRRSRSRLAGALGITRGRRTTSTRLTTDRLRRLAHGNAQRDPLVGSR
jgi:hypothetical protein